jgi:effector-binding domain-containing protein
MTTSKKYLIITAIFLSLMVVLSLILSKQYSAKALIEIDAPSNFVFNALNDLAYQSEYNSKAYLDTSFLMQCVGITKGTNASCDYKSHTYGAGVMRILHSNGDTLSISDEPNGASPRLFGYKTVSKDSTHTTLKVCGSATSGFIINLWNFIHEWKLTKQMKMANDNLKTFVENRFKNKVYNGFKVQTIMERDRYFIMHKSEVKMENLEQYYTQNISALYQTALQNRIAIQGMPCGLFFDWDDKNGKAVMAAALPTVVESNVVNTESFHIAPGLSLKIEYRGESSKSGLAHTAMDAYILDHRLQQQIPVIEEYMTNPTEEPDPTKWITNVYYYVVPL